MNSPFNAITSLNTSKNYKLVKSFEVSNKLEALGFELEKTSYINCKKPEKRGFQKHLMIFGHNGLVVNDENRLRLIVTNSHDKSTALVFSLGIYRSVCANGIVVGSTFFERRIAHNDRDIFRKIDETIEEFFIAAKRLKERIIALNNIYLNVIEISAVIKKLSEVRVGKPIDYIDERQFAPSRIGDEGNNAYVVFNRIQEVLTKKSVTFEIQENDKVIQLRTRPLRSSLKDLSINKELWTEFENYLAA